MMRITPPPYKVSSDELINLFKRRSDGNFILEPCVGQGSVQIFNLEKGLQARVWDCSFKEGIEIYNGASSVIKKPYFNLAFFADMEGLNFADDSGYLHGNFVWDTIFTSAASDCKMYLSPKAKGKCLSISFSKRWIDINVLENNDAFKNLKEKIGATECFLLFESMTSSEKELVVELLESSWRSSLGSFYVKSIVLKIIYDYFYKIKELETFCINSFGVDTSIAEVEKYLDQHVTGAIPNLKNLAHSFSTSESTLKRHFKKRHGMSMSAYFIYKKMEYAGQLMHEKNINAAEAAAKLGYKNVKHFVTMYERYIGANQDIRNRISTQSTGANS